VYLHPKQEVPQVRDLGFAIAPGVHALIAIRLNEVSDGVHNNTLTRKIRKTSFTNNYYVSLF